MNFLWGFCLLSASWLANQEIIWNTAVPQTLELAKVRNIPVVILVVLDKERDSEATMALYRLKKFAELSAQILFILAVDGIEQHPQQEKKFNGEIQKVCALYGMPCAEHQKSMTAIRARFIRAEFHYPLQIFLNPDGSESYRLQRYQEPALLYQELLELLEHAGKGLSQREHDYILQEIKTAQQEYIEGQLKQAQQRIDKLQKNGYPQAMRDYMDLTWKKFLRRHQPKNK